MRILAENKEADVRMEWDINKIRPLSVRSKDMHETFSSMRIAFDFYDGEIKKALATPALDLEAVSYPFKCQTDDGRNATVIDKRFTEDHPGKYVALVDHGSSEDWGSNDELVFLSDRVGHLYLANGYGQTGAKLTSLPPPKPITKEGWLNLYKRPYATSPGAHSRVWETETEARAMICNDRTYVDTAKVTWEE